MKIYKTSWSQARKNELLHFYALEPNYTRGQVVLYERPFSISCETFKNVLNASRQKKNEPLFNGMVLHVCFDVSSGRLYLPDAAANVYFFKTPALKQILQECYRALKDKYSFDNIPSLPVVKGDPLGTLRLRQLNDYASAQSFIEKHLVTQKQDKGILETPVVEANLSIMPETVKALGINVKTQGMWVDETNGETISFTIAPDASIGQYSAILAHAQKTPFVLINISPEAKVSEADKERIVVTELQHRKTEDTDTVNRQDLMSQTYYSMKYILYLGWSVKELGEYIFSPEHISSLRDFWYYATYLLQAMHSLERAGYSVIKKIPFYYMMRIDEDFPIRFKTGPTGQAFDVNGQPEVMQILHFDSTNKIIVLRSSLYVPPQTAKKIFSAEGEVVVAEYDPDDRYLKTNTSPDSIGISSPATLKVTCEDVWREGGKKPEDMTPGKYPIKAATTAEIYFEKKRISDFYQAADFIKDICYQLDTPERPVPFQDINVYVGPWRRASREGGLAGGYVSEARLREHNIPIPFEIMKGLMLYPPAIIVDTDLYPSVADRAHVLVHEYRHHINQMIGIPSPKYEIPKGEGELSSEDIQKWLIYLNSPDERLAHITQIKYFIGMGLSKEQIMRSFLPDGITYNNMPIARKYDEYINTAQKELVEELKTKEERKRINQALEKLTTEAPPEEEIEVAPPLEY